MFQKQSKGNTATRSLFVRQHLRDVIALQSQATKTTPVRPAPVPPKALGLTRLNAAYDQCRFVKDQIEMFQARGSPTTGAPISYATSEGYNTSSQRDQARR